MMVDPDLTELVDDHGDTAAVLGGEDAIEQRGFARAEETGQDDDRDLGGRLCRVGRHRNLEVGFNRCHLQGGRSLYHRADGDQKIGVCIWPITSPTGSPSFICTLPRTMV